MARPKTATALLKLRGSFKKDPQKKRENEPIVKNPFPKEIPEHLDADAVACWKEIVAVTPAGVLTGADIITVEVVAVLLSQFRQDRNMTTSRLSRLTTEAGKLGLNPSGRAGLVVEQPKRNKFADI